MVGRVCIAQPSAKLYEDAGTSGEGHSPDQVSETQRMLFLSRQVQDVDIFYAEGVVMMIPPGSLGVGCAAKMPSRDRFRGDARQALRPSQGFEAAHSRIAYSLTGGVRRVMKAHVADYFDRSRVASCEL